MKTKLILFALAISCLGACKHSSLELVNNGSSNYEIIIPENADSLELKSAQELQKYLELKSGVNLSIVSENKSATDYHIWIGNTSQGKSLLPEANEIVIKTQGNDLIIVGGDAKSSLYGVYTFQENYLGCRFYAPDAEVIPKEELISVPLGLDYRYTPPIHTRTVHSKLFYDDHDFADKRKATHEAFPNYVPSARVHTFHHYVPADKYLKSHPEYYALRNGRRIPTQLCLTNTEVLALVKDTVASLLREFPQSNVISVSQDDNQQIEFLTDCNSTLSLLEIFIIRIVSVNIIFFSLLVPNDHQVNFFFHFHSLIFV